MKKSFVVVLTLAVACSGTDTSPRQSNLALATSVSTSSFRAGTFIEVDIVVTNRGASTEHFDGDPCPFVFVVRGEDSKEVGPGVGDCGGSAVLSAPVSLEPGESYTIRENWRGTSRDDASVTEWLPPGKYSLYGQLKDVQTVESTPVVIEILR